MSQLAKLKLKAVERVAQQDATETRRRKLIAALAEQQLVLKARLKGEPHVRTKKRWVKGADGEHTQTEIVHAAQPWFWERDCGWYVRTRRIIGRNSSVFVAKTTQAGEPDKAIEAVTKAKAAKAAA